MSFTGGSIAQAALISGAEGRLTAVETLAAGKVAQVAYDAKVALLEAADAAAAGRLDVVEGRATALESDVAGRVQAEIDAKVANSVYGAKVALLDAADAAAAGRLDAVESRATALESDLAGRVQAEIDAKVAQGVFDNLASELRTADSALTTALATKVATVVQNGVDDAQNAIIALKKNAADVDAKDAEHDGKLAALVEFVNAMLATYTITKPDGNAYAWTGAIQGLTFGGSSGSGGSGGSGGEVPPPPSGDYPIVINSGANGEYTITSTQAFAQNYVRLVEMEYGIPNFNMNFTLNGNNGTVSAGTLTFQSGYFQPYNAGKKVALYALPSYKQPWDSFAEFSERVSPIFTLV